MVKLKEKTRRKIEIILLILAIIASLGVIYAVIRLIIIKLIAV